MFTSSFMPITQPKTFVYILFFFMGNYKAHFTDGTGKVNNKYMTQLIKNSSEFKNNPTQRTPAHAESLNHLRMQAFLVCYSRMCLFHSRIPLHFCVLMMSNTKLRQINLLQIRHLVLIRAYNIIRQIGT